MKKLTGWHVPDGRSKCRGLWSWASPIWSRGWVACRSKRHSHEHLCYSRRWQTRRSSRPRRRRETHRRPRDRGPKSRLPPPAFSETPRNTLRTSSSQSPCPLRTAEPQISSLPFSVGKMWNLRRERRGLKLRGLCWWQSERECQMGVLVKYQWCSWF